MSRFGQKDLLKFWAGINHGIDFFITPGVQIETMGREEIYTDLINHATYAWCDVLDKKLTKPRELVHYGCSPFVYACALVPDIEKTYNVVFLPRGDIATQITIKDEHIEQLCQLIAEIEAPRVIAFGPDLERWRDRFKDKNVLIECVSEDVMDPNWQLKLSLLLKGASKVYVPIVGSGVFYALYSGCNVQFYNIEHIYSGTTAAFINTYVPANLTEAYFNLENLLKEVVEDTHMTDEKRALVNYFLSVHKVQSRVDLKSSLYLLSMTSPTYNGYACNRWMSDVMENRELFAELPHIEIEGMLSQKDADEALERKYRQYADVYPSEKLMKVLSAL